MGMYDNPVAGGTVAQAAGDVAAGANPMVGPGTSPMYSNQIVDPGQQRSTLVPDDYAPPPEPPMPQGGTVLDPILQGASLGWSDEGFGLYEKLKGGSYTEGRDRARENLESFSTRNPYGSSIAEMAGGMLPVSKGVKYAGLGLNMAQKLARLSGAGAGIGAVGGLGIGEGGLAEQAASMGTGATIGAVASPVVGGATALLKGTGGMLTRHLPIDSREDRRIVQKLKDGNIDLRTPEGQQELLRQRELLGPEGMLADTTIATQRQLDAVNVKPGPQGEMINTRLEDRQGGRNQRVTDAANRDLGDSETFMATIEDQLQKTKTDAGPSYEAARQVPLQMNGNLTKLLSNPAGKKAYAEALELAQIAGEDLPPMSMVFPDGTGINYISTDAAHQLKVALDKVIDKHTDINPITGARKLDNTGRAYLVYKKKLQAEMFDQNKAYKAANDEFAGNIALTNAAEMGKRFVRDDDWVIGSELRGMTSGEKTYFRHAASKAIRDQIMNAEDGADAYRRMFGSEFKRRRIEQLFEGDTDAYNEFAKAMERESRFASTRATVQGNSATVRRLEDQEDLLNPDPGIFKRITKAAWSEFTKNAPDRDVKLAGMLTDMNPVDIVRLMEVANKQNKQFYSSLINATTLAGINPTTGAFTDAFMPHEAKPAQ